tara:strand:- start:303 stop:467 length:165 start_codon:yes stop_codon:yes gene_type:complete
MILTKQQLAMSLCELVKDDYELLNDMILDYLDRLDDKDIDGLEMYVNSNINELM